MLAYRAWAKFLAAAAITTAGTLSLGRMWGLPGYMTALATAALVGCLFQALCKTRSGAIPCLNYHSVTFHPGWMQIGRYLSIPPDLFERQLRYLADRNYRSLQVRELNADLAQPRPGERRICLTFDDGYLDNWCYAFPLLERYGFKATVFLCGKFLDPRPVLRPTSVDPGFSPDQVKGFVSLEEVRRLHRSGLIECAAHGHSHTRIFSSPEIRYFHFPPRENIWLFWNLFGHELDWWTHPIAEKTPRGYPVFTQKQGLQGPAFLPDPLFVAHLLERAASLDSDGGNAQNRLREAARAWLGEGRSPGRMETPEEYRARCKTELDEPKRMLELAIGAPVRSFCWPENNVAPELEDMAYQAGYESLVSNEYPGMNRKPAARARFSRIFIGTHYLGFASRQLDFLGFVVRLRLAEGDYRWLPVHFMAARFAKCLTFLRRRKETAFGVLP
jgi:peptidoglycan/xylan/chitin deacetylase (PgdA/CDA1 family)